MVYVEAGGRSAVRLLVKSYLRLSNANKAGKDLRKRRGLYRADTLHSVGSFRENVRQNCARLTVTILADIPGATGH